MSGALLAAVTPALVSSSQLIKADMPCALLISLSLLCYVRDLASDRRGSRWLVAAALLAGAAMGTKYYGIVLVPSYLLWEGGRAMRGVLGWRPMLGRQIAIVLLFVIGFFVVSPYNLLDPTWIGEVGRKLTTAVDGETPVFEIDASKEYLPGPAAWLGAGIDFLQRLVDRSGLGLPLAALFALGLLASLSRRRLHGLWALVALPCAIFLAVSVLFAPYHAQARHIAAIMPLLCLFTWPAARAVAAIVSASPERSRRLAVTLVALVASVNLVRSVLADVAIMRMDSRTLAHEWVVENLSREDRLLAEDDGPTILPNRLAIARMREKLERLEVGPFVIHEDQRLDILERYESPQARNVDVLSRQWWLNQEKTDRQLALSLIDSDMGNPLISRVPRPLEEYRAEGVRYVLSTSVGGRWLATFEDPEVQFPSFVKFYRALAELEPVATFDPAQRHGKGPIIWIHDLSRLDGGRRGTSPR
jgi:hypothetical protein